LTPFRKITIKIIIPGGSGQVGTLLALESPLLTQWQAGGAVLDSAFRTRSGRYEWTYHGLRETNKGGLPGDQSAYASHHQRAKRAVL